MKQPIVLTHGSFSCTGDFAVEIAHMLSNAEACVISGAADFDHVNDVLSGYLRGDVGADEAIATFNRWFNEHNAPSTAAAKE